MATLTVTNLSSHPLSIGDNTGFGVSFAVAGGGHPLWVKSTSYKEGDIVTNDTGKLYYCDVDGTSAGSGGPTGTTATIAGITDNQAKWHYVGIAPHTHIVATSDQLAHTASQLVYLADNNLAYYLIVTTDADTAPIVGAKGDKGDTGARGATGAAGPTAYVVQKIFTGAAATTNIAVKNYDNVNIPTAATIVGAVNLTDGANFPLSAAKAYQGTWPTTGFDSVLEAHTAGAAGNTIDITLVGDSVPAAGVSVVVAGTLVTIHYESGTSTVADVESAIDALSGGDNIVDVKTPGTAITVLTSPADDFVTVRLAHGYDAHDELPTVTTTGNVQFAVTNTTGKKILLTWIEPPPA